MIIKLKQEKLLIPFSILLVSAIFLLINYFLPFASSNDEYRDYLTKYENNYYSKEVEMINSDAKDISLFEFAKIYNVADDILTSSDDKLEAIICLIIMIFIAIFTMITIVFVLLKKPIATIIFNLLSLLCVYLIKWDFGDRNVLPNSSYNLGISYYLYFIFTIIITITSIIMMIIKKKNKTRQ